MVSMHSSGIPQVPCAEWNLPGKPRGRVGAGRSIGSASSQPSREELMGA